MKMLQNSSFFTKVKSRLLVMALVMTPGVVFGQGGLADGDTGNFGQFITGLTNLINQFLIPFLIALCVLGFIYGVFVYFITGSTDEEKRAQGRSLMLYALIGFVAIVVLWGIVEWLAQAFGFDERDAFDGARGPATGG